MENKKWKAVSKSYQIADTGDYDGHYELNNNDMILISKEDEDDTLEKLENVAKIFNELNVVTDDYWKHYAKSIEDELKYQSSQTLSQSELLAEVIEVLEQCLSRIDKKSKDTWDIKARFVAESALQKYKSTKS